VKTKNIEHSASVIDKKFVESKLTLERVNMKLDNCELRNQDHQIDTNA
jgi:hypothetical protein